MNDLLDAIDGHNPSGSDSYEADCPECRADDQLVIWPDNGDTGSVWCRKCNWDKSGAAYLHEVEGMSYSDAYEFFGVEPEASGDGAPNRSSSSGDTEDNPDPEQNPDASSSEEGPEQYWKEYGPPSEKWRASALAFCGECKERLWSGEKAAKSALSYLHDRGFNDRTIEAAGLGVNVEDRYPKRTEWGLEPKEDRSDGGKVWLPRGVVIPWANPGGIAGVNIRRPSGDVNPNADEHWERRKYQRAPGPSAPLYGAPVEGAPIVLVEGEFDALAVLQEAEDLVSPVATGSASGARRERWRTLLAEAPAVLVSFDEGEAGERASEVWKAALPNAIRWPPHADDTGEMLQQGRSLRTWVRCGLEAARRSLR